MHHDIAEGRDLSLQALTSRLQTFGKVEAEHIGGCPDVLAQFREQIAAVIALQPGGEDGLGSGTISASSVGTTVAPPGPAPCCSVHLDTAAEPSTLLTSCLATVVHVAQVHNYAMALLAVIMAVASILAQGPQAEFS